MCGVNMEENGKHQRHELKYFVYVGSAEDEPPNGVVELQFISVKIVQSMKNKLALNSVKAVRRKKYVFAEFGSAT